MSNPLVTLVVATYNRPDTLIVTLKSVIAQSVDDWIALVIGDHCDESTELAIVSLNDTRIQFLNLPVRTYEQAGPNSVGLALTRTKYIGWLNHDDVLLPDHLETALHTISRENADLFIGLSAFGKTSLPADGGLRKPIFNSTNSIKRRPWHTVGRDYAYEPCSAWVMVTEKAREVGYWKGSLEIYESSLQNWIMRAWRRGCVFAFGESVTLLKVETHAKIEERSGSYSVKSLEHKYIDKFILGRRAEEIRNVVWEDGAQFNHLRPVTWLQRLKRFAIDRAAALVYYFTGYNFYNVLNPVRGIRKGERLVHRVRRRTGSTISETVDISSLVHDMLKDSSRTTARPQC